MDIAMQDVLRWAHILAMVYWLGGEWGVFTTSRMIVRVDLSLEERARHMESAYRIDILARTGIILLLPLGIHMGYNLGTHPWGGHWIILNWVLGSAWLALCWAAFFTRNTDLGLTLTKIDEAIRYAVIPALFFVGLATLFTGWPLTGNWYAAKVSLYAFALCIGLVLRFIMRHWVLIFRAMAVEGPTPALQGRLEKELKVGFNIAYLYWVVIATTCFLGATKPF